MVGAGAVGTVPASSTHGEAVVGCSGVWQLSPWQGLGMEIAKEGKKKACFGHVKLTDLLPPRRKSCPVTPRAGRDASVLL